MKFTNGMWQTKSGFEIRSPAEAYDFLISPNSVTVYGPYCKIENRGNTLNTGILTVTIRAPRRDILSVKMQNFMGEQKAYPDFELNEEDFIPEIELDGEKCVIKSGNLRAEIQIHGSWGIRYFYKEKELTSSEPKSMAYILDDTGTSYIREQLSLDVSENIYGLGERFTAFVKNGQQVDLWNEDGGTNSEQTYKNIPFFLSSKGYGVFVNEPGKVSFEIASEVITKNQFSVPGESMEYFLIGGDSLKEVISHYTDLTGHPSLVPAWTFGLWLTTSFTTNYDEKTVMSFIDGMLERGIPLTTFHFDCFWMKGFEWCSFEWDSKVFPDPEGMIRRIKEKGLHVCVWINPYIAQKSPLFREGMEKGYFVKTCDGSIWQWDLWQAGMALVDFTNPDAVKWYQGYLSHLIDMGVDCFKTDFGERIPVKDPYFGKKAAEYGIQYFDGSNPNRMHNYYTELYNRTVFELLEARLGKGQACLFARSATAGGQKYPVHWGGDSLSNYPSMAQSLRGGLSLALCGFGYWSHDIGGFEEGCNADIFNRWTQFGLLSSHSRYHGSKEYKVPWLYGEESVEVTKKFTRLKLRLMPYLYAQAVKTSLTGIPMMRPMLLEYPDDPTCSFVDTQYLLGDSLLVAPIFNRDGEARYYLPEGIWTNILTGEEKTGGTWYRETFDYLHFPLLARENSLICFGSHEDRPDYDYSESPVFALYSLQDGKTASTSLFADGGKLLYTVEVSRNGTKISFRITGDYKPYTLLLAGIPHISAVTGDATIQESICGTRISSNSSFLYLDLAETIG